MSGNRRKIVQVIENKAPIRVLADDGTVWEWNLTMNSRVLATGKVVTGGWVRVWFAELPDKDDWQTQ